MCKRTNYIGLKENRGRKRMKEKWGLGTGKPQDKIQVQENEKKNHLDC